MKQETRREVRQRLRRQRWQARQDKRVKAAIALADVALNDMVNTEEEALSPLLAAILYRAGRHAYFRGVDNSLHAAQFLRGTAQPPLLANREQEITNAIERCERSAKDHAL